MINLNEYLILVYIYCNLDLGKLTIFSEINLNDSLTELENKKLIRKGFHCVNLTKLGKEVYMEKKIKNLIKNGILKEIEAVAPFVCDNCIYYKNKLENLCKYIKCDSNKI
ncbi:hypothetical protein, partial [Cetobacterium sp.]|uniref:hypothetical protein n=1 Tax=Cetobacterium sp. TaxID=2071632 RepID=UPI003EE47915